MNEEKKTRDWFGYLLWGAVLVGLLQSVVRFDKMLFPSADELEHRRDALDKVEQLERRKSELEERRTTCLAKGWPEAMCLRGAGSNHLEWADDFDRIDCRELTCEYEIGTLRFSVKLGDLWGGDRDEVTLIVGYSNENDRFYGGLNPHSGCFVVFAEGRPVFEINPDSGEIHAAKQEPKDLIPGSCERVRMSEMKSKLLDAQ